MREFAQTEKQRLAQEMTPKFITGCQDETFHPETCLVAMEPASNLYSAGKVGGKSEGRDLVADDGRGDARVTGRARPIDQ